MHSPARRVAYVCSVVLGVACADGDEDHPEPAEPSATQCTVERGIFEVAPSLDDPDDGCHDWVYRVHGRAVRVDGNRHGSASVWARASAGNTVVIATAAHVMTPCDRYFSNLDDLGMPGTECPAALLDPSAAIGEAHIRMAMGGGGPSSSQWSAHFGLYHPQMLADDYRGIGVPIARDFAVYAVDGQVFEAWSTGAHPKPDPITDTSPALHDPAGLVDATPNWRDAEAGTDVMVVGFPEREGNPNGRLLHASIGTVLDEDEARAAIDALRDAGDEEGTLPYDPEVEFLFVGSATFGLSGSGVFNPAGEQVGIAVRASFADIGVQYVRAVRMRHVASSIAIALDATEPAARGVIGAYLPPV